MPGRMMTISFIGALFAMVALLKVDCLHFAPYLPRNLESNTILLLGFNWGSFGQNALEAYDGKRHNHPRFFHQETI
jgi:hypothetical protein